MPINIMYRHEDYNHNQERKDIYIKRFERMYDTKILGNQKSLMLFDIITTLGGNKRRDSGAFIEPMVIINIDNGIIDYVMREYKHDHLLSYTLAGLTRPNDKELMTIYYDLIYLYLKQSLTH